MVGGKIIPRIRLTLAKDLVEVEAELGKSLNKKINKRIFFSPISKAQIQMICTASILLRRNTSWSVAGQSSA